MIEKLNVILANFEIESTLSSLEKLNTGHINDTFLITTRSSNKYILQRLNNTVFLNPEDVVNNKVFISEYLLNKSKLRKTSYQSITFIKTKTSDYFYIDNINNYWNLSIYIEGSSVYEVAKNDKMVFEAGKLYGNFINETSSINVAMIKTTLPNFHDIPTRFNQFEKSLLYAADSLKKMANSQIKFALHHKNDLYKLSKLVAKGIFPTRVTHNDAKLSNVLFDNNHNGMAVIDLDTVMPGIVHNDFGDSIRSICSNTREDDIRFNKATVNLDYYKSYCDGFAQETKNILTKEEIDYLPLGVKTIIFIMGLRFLTDFLNNNIYYKTKYNTHNLDRATNQFALTQNVLDMYDDIKEITYNTFK